jgi:hypothetical protein
MAWRTLDGSSRVLLGAARNASNPPYAGWQWVDGTPSTNLNCASSAQCASSLYGPGEPKCVLAGLSRVPYLEAHVPVNLCSDLPIHLPPPPCDHSNAGAGEDKLAMEAGTGAVSDVASTALGAFVCEFPFVSLPGHSCSGVSMV